MTRALIIASMLVFAWMALVSKFESKSALAFGLLVGGMGVAAVLVAVAHPPTAAILTFLTLLGFDLALLAQFKNPESLLFLFWLPPGGARILTIVSLAAAFLLACLVVTVHRSFPDPLLSLPLSVTALLVLADVIFYVIYPHPVGPVRLHFHTFCALAEMAAVTWLVLAAGHLALERNATRRRIQSQKRHS